ncbi:MAG TPA: tripartite tricarboxylate transporter permease [Xanthobacteraceae bacterium]|nr:tripartite tricarboxylate transporter permease [Xanthobacteraceae bacterium]
MQPDMIASAVHALHLLLEPARLMILFLGVLIGLAIGVLPGLNGIVGMAMLIPFTYNLDEYTAFALLLGMAAVITSSDFITAVLFGVPGHVGAAATVIDGHAMAKKGEAGRAFGAGFAASLFGGIVGAIVLAVSIPILRPIMLSVGSPELLAFTLFGLSMVATLSGRAPLKGLTAAGLGLMIAMVGSRSPSGTLRWTFGWLYLWDGVPLIPATLGIFALPELAELAVSRKRIAGDNAPNIDLSSQWQGVRDVARHWWLVLRCGVLGVGLGAIPGIGSSVIDWIAYGYAQRTEKNSESFGTGDVRGVIAPESSNNSKEGGHLVPTIAFGVPAGASMAILLGAFLMHGLTPGPDMLTKHLDLTYMIVWSLTLAHVMGAIICLACSRWLAQVSRIRPEILLPVIIALVFVAAFEGEHDWGDLYLLFGFGIVGWIMKRLGWPRPPMVLGIVVGGIFERYLFISTQLYGWGWLVRWPVLAILACVVWVLYRPLSQIAKTLVEQFRSIGHRAQFGAAPVFSLAVIVSIVSAIASSTGWPHDAKLVPLTACGMALTAAVLNLINELFGGAPTALAARDPGVKVSAQVSDLGVTDDAARRRAVSFFAWMAAFIALVWLIGFIPAIALFVFAYMRFGFGEPSLSSLGFAAATTVICIIVFHWALQVAWPPSLLGDLFPALRAATRLI